MFWNELWAIVSLALYLLNAVLSIFVSVRLISGRRDPVKTLSWLMVLLLLPYFGIVLYFFFGRNFRKDKMFSRKGAADIQLRREAAKGAVEQYESEDGLPEEIKSFRKLIVQNARSAHSTLSTNNEMKIYFSGKDSIEAMLQAMEGAVSHIHLQSFIIENDKVGNCLRDLLIRKAKEGVEVRMMFDGYGGRKLNNAFLQPLRDAGVEVLNFSPFRLFFLPPIVNYRNHRKILVVDGKVGFLGGVNIADRYFDGGDFAEWRDTHIRIVGQSVMSLQASFLLDRYFIVNKNLRFRGRYYPYFDFDTNLLAPDSGKYYTQIIASGPDSHWSAIMQCYFTAITQAKKYIHIITPYFIPSETILNAIKITALSNVEVSLMIPERSDTWLTNWGTMSFVSELLEAGVKVYFFKRGFNHSKVLSIDGEFCIIGSANMDNRSFEHHFEVTSVIYDRECAKVIDDRFDEDLKRCSAVNKTKWNKRPWRFKFYESLARLVSPLL